MSGLQQIKTEKVREVMEGAVVNLRHGYVGGAITELTKALVTLLDQIDGAAEDERVDAWIESESIALERGED